MYNHTTEVNEPIEQIAYRRYQYDMLHKYGVDLNQLLHSVFKIAYTKAKTNPDPDLMITMPDMLINEWLHEYEIPIEPYEEFLYHTYTDSDKMLTILSPDERRYYMAKRIFKFGTSLPRNKDDTFVNGFAIYSYTIKQGTSLYDFYHFIEDEFDIPITYFLNELDTV